MFIDETWASTNMARVRGRAPRGERLRAAIPYGHWKTTTFVAGLRNTGMVAPMVLDGPINGVAFQAYVDQVLVPELRPGDIVIMDNLGSHKGPDIRVAIEAAGASLLYLPPYSPDFNPVRGTAPDAIGSRTPSPSSRPCYARRPSEPSRASGPPSATSWMPSRPPNAPTISAPLGMTQTDRKTL